MDGTVWIGFVRLISWTSGCLGFVNTVLNSRDAQNAGDSWLAGKMLASQTNICPV